MKTRPPEPKFLIDYRELIKAGPPRCCFTCEYYGVDGLCVEFFMNPPAEFAETPDVCQLWEEELPF